MSAPFDVISRRIYVCLTTMIRMMLLRGEQCEHTLRQTIGQGDDSLKEKLR